MKSSNVEYKEKEEKNQNKSKNLFISNLKGDYFLQKVFDNLEKKKLLNILKYNKTIKKRIKININDYKEYSEKYSSIEIELKPINNKDGKLFNIKFGDEKYYHIYFDNNKEEDEIKRKFITKEDKIKIVKIIIDYQVKSFKRLFYRCNCCESIYFKRFSRNNINNMNYMFYMCPSLKELNINNFNTENVTDMNGMFSYCRALKELNLNNFNTKNVIDMNGMFSGCFSLKELNLINFYTNNVTDMAFMFTRCSSLNDVHH